MGTLTEEPSLYPSSEAASPKYRASKMSNLGLFPQNTIS